MGDNEGQKTFEIPSECIAGVVKNEGPNFEIEVKKVPVPEIGKLICTRNPFGTQESQGNI